MCWAVAAASGGLSIIGNVLSTQAQAAQAEAQGKAAVASMNRDFMNLEIQRQDAFDAAVQEITKTRLNSMQLNSSVEAAVNEDLGNGRTADLIKRDVAADEARNVASIQDQYQAKSNEIDLNKETSLLSTKDYIANIPKPSESAFWINSASAVLSAYTAAKSARADAESKGIKWDFWGPVTEETKSSTTPTIGMGGLKALDRY